MARSPAAAVNLAVMDAAPLFSTSRLDSVLTDSGLVGSTHMDSRLVGSELLGSGTNGSGFPVSAAEGVSGTGAAPLDAVASRFEDFYAAHRDEMVRALSLALRDAALGAEAADEAFARACQRWRQVSTYANPQGWVFRVGLNWARSFLRRVRRERERRPLLAQPHATEDRARDVDLERALATLNDSHRTVIVARFYLDWSVAETAEALDIAAGTVKSRLSRGLEQLRDVLEAAPDEGEDS